MKPTPKHQIFLLKIFKCFIFIFFFGMFLRLMKDVFDKFQSKITSSGISLRSDDVTEKLLPLLTLCAWPVKRNPGLHFTKDDFQRNSFELEDFFHNFTLAVLK